MAVKEKTDCGDEMEWSAEEELQLFKALGGLKPFGINKHFYMACICERLSNALKREILPDVVWAHLKTMYNLEILDQIQPLPFPQNQCDFSLPDDDFSHLISKKLQEVKDNGEDGGGGGSSSSTPAGLIIVVKSRTSTPQPSQSNAVLTPAGVSQSKTTIATTNTTTTTATTIGISSTTKTCGASSTVAKSYSSNTGMSSSSATSTPNTQSAIQSRTSSQSSNASYKSLSQQSDNQTSSSGGGGGGGSGIGVSSQNLLANSLNSNATGGSCITSNNTTGAINNNNGNGKSVATSANNTVNQKEFEKKITAKLASLEIPKRTTKRTRGSMSIESNSPSTTPPPTQTKRRRI